MSNSFPREGSTSNSHVGLRPQAHMIPPDVEFWELDGDELVVNEVPA